MKSFNFRKLPPLSNDDINKKTKHIKYFRGVFAKNILPKNIQNFECGVINNDNIPSFNNGTHWVAYYNHPNSKYIEFFDSFGLPPAKEIKDFLLKSRKNIIMNSGQIQDIESQACGYFCIDYILSRHKGKSLYNSIGKFNIKNLIINENLLFKV